MNNDNYSALFMGMITGFGILVVFFIIYLLVIYATNDLRKGINDLEDENNSLNQWFEQIRLVNLKRGNGEKLMIPPRPPKPKKIIY